MPASTKCSQVPKNTFYCTCQHRCPSCVLVLPPSPFSITSSDLKEQILPPVIVWDPFSSGEPLLRCIECNQPIERRNWKVGQSQGLQPRLLHDIDSIVILISCQDKCTNNHYFLTTDPRVLKLIPEADVPFILLHKTGFMKSFCRKVVGLIGESTSISAVE